MDLKEHLLLFVFRNSFMARSIFLATISLYGKVRYAAEQYDHLVIMKHDISDQPAMPCLTTMRKTNFSRLLIPNFVKSEFISVSIKQGYSTSITKSSHLSQRYS